MGVNVVYGPVVDVATNSDNAALGIRSFGDDPAQLAVRYPHPLFGGWLLGRKTEGRRHPLPLHRILLFERRHAD